MSKSLFNSSLTQRFGLRFPLIVAPMAGGPTTPELVVASCEAGALGSMGAAYLAPAAINDFAEKVRSKTDRPFAINLFAPTKNIVVTQEAFERALQKTQRFRDELNL